MSVRAPRIARPLLLALSLLVALSPIAGTAAGGRAAGGGVWQVIAPHRPPNLFHEALGIAVDALHNVYIADEIEQRVKKFAPSGRFLASWPVETPRAVVVDAQGYIYVLSIGVVKLSPQGQVLARWTGEPFRHAFALAPTSHGALLVLSQPQTGGTYGLAQIDRVATDGTSLATWRTEPLQRQLVVPNGIAEGPNGSVYVTIATAPVCYRACVTHTRLLYRFTSTGALLGRLQAPQSMDYGPLQTVDSAGNAYIARETANGGILKLAPNGTVLTTFGHSGTDPGSYGDVLRVAVSGNLLYVADSHVNQLQFFGMYGVVRILDLSGRQQQQWGAPFPGLAAQTLTFGPGITARGRWVYTAGGLGAYTVIGPNGALRGYGATSGRAQLVRGPSGIAVDAHFNVYVSDQAGCVTKFSSGGRALARWCFMRFGQSFLGGIVLDRSGNLYVAATLAEQIVRLSPRGRVIGRFGSFGHAPGQFAGPTGLAIGGSGNLFVADSGNRRVQKLTLGGRPLASWGGYPLFEDPTGVAVDARGNIFMSDRFRSRITELSTTGRPVAQWGGSGSYPGQFLVPEGLAIDSLGNLYVADAGNGRVQRMTARH